MSSYTKKTCHLINTFLSYLTVRNLAATFVICSLIMVSISAMLGLNPHLRVFVFASPNTCNEIVDTLHRISPEIEVLTPREELNELSTLTRLGCITTIIVADYPSPAQTDGYVLEGLTYAMHIIVIKEHEATGLANIVVHSFPKERTWITIPFDRLSIVKVSELEGHMKMLLTDYSQFRILKGLFNWAPDYSVYIFGIKLIAILSLILLLLQTMLASLFALTRDRLIDLFEVILISVATFLSSQAIYLACSVAVGMPLGLHATAHGVTALSQLGYFSESYMRSFFCASGFVLATVAVFREKIAKSSKLFMTVVTVIGGFTIMIVSLFYLNLQTRQIITQAARWLFNTSEKISAIYFFPIINAITSPSIFGITSFLPSRTITAYIAGAMATILLRKLQKISRLILFSICVVFIGFGGQRVGNMLPYQAYASILPGIISGLGLVALFLAIDLLERSFKVKKPRKLRTLAHGH